MTLGASVGYSNEGYGSGEHPERFWQHYGEGQPSPSRDSVQFGALPRPRRCSSSDGVKNCGSNSNQLFGVPSNTVRNPASSGRGGPGGGAAQGAPARTGPTRLLQPHTADSLDRVPSPRQ